MKLTNKTVAGLVVPAGSSEIIVFDDGLPGFGLRIRASGARTWVFQYAIARRQRRVTLGKSPALRAEKARETASELHARVRLGFDPAGEKFERQTRAAETVGATLKAYLPSIRARVRPKTIAEVERHLLTYARPLHGLQLAAVNRRAIAARLSELAATSGAVTANRVRASLSAFFAWAIRQGLLEVNPTIGTGKEPEKPRDRVLDNAEIRTIWTALDDDQYGALIRLLLLTGARANEIGKLRWAEICNGEILLPAERVKNKHAHRMQLSSLALEILEAQPRSGDFVFGRRGFNTWGAAKTKLDGRICPAISHWVIHDLRRTAASGMASLGIPPHVVESCLNHRSGTIKGVAAIYNRYSYENEKHQALDRWAEHVLVIVEGRDSKIVPLRGEATIGRPRL